MDKRSATIITWIGVLLTAPSVYALLSILMTGSWAVALHAISIALIALPAVGLGLALWGAVHLLRRASP